MPGELNSDCNTPYAISAGINEIFIPFPGAINDSLQVGDSIFVVKQGDTSTTNNMSVASKAPIKIGTLLSFSDGGINIEFNNCASCPCAPERHDYLMFAKSKSVNTSGLKGYYLKAVFKNNSTKYAELFSVGTEVTESSK